MKPGAVILLASHGVGWHGLIYGLAEVVTAPDLGMSVDRSTGGVVSTTIPATVPQSRLRAAQGRRRSRQHRAPTSMHQRGQQGSEHPGQAGHLKRVLRGHPALPHLPGHPLPSGPSRPPAIPRPRRPPRGRRYAFHAQRIATQPPAAQAVTCGLSSLARLVSSRSQRCHWSRSPL
jgi:hypothetical protein